MLDQNVYNLILAAVGALTGWWMKAMWESLGELKAADANLASQIGDLKVLVAGQYVKAETFEKTVTALFTKLDRIEDKLDHKADKL